MAPNAAMASARTSGNRERFLVRLSIGPLERSLDWPGDIELCADALRMKLEGQANGSK